jgi:Hermansky-Pudlak syndrome 1 protein
MEGYFVFSTSNELVFKHANGPMNGKLLAIAHKMGLVEAESEEISSDTMMHIFNPLLANLKFMLIQFDNSFNYVKCQHGFNMVFDEYFGFMFVTINDQKSINYMQRSQAIFINFLRHLLGPAIFQLKTDNKKAELLVSLMRTWKKLYEENQEVYLEAFEQVTVNNDVKKNVVSSLEIALEKLKQDPQHQRNHAVILIGNKFLSMFSSRTSHQLTPADILFLNIFCQTIEVSQQKIDSYMLFMRGTNNSCIPHKVHRIAITSEITLLLLSEYGNAIISANLYDAFVQLNKIKILQFQADLDALVIETEKLDKAVKSVIEVHKKIKTNSPEIDESAKNFQNKYESLKKKYVEMLKIMDKNQLVKVESYFPYFLEATNDFYRVSFIRNWCIVEISSSCFF